MGLGAPRKRVKLSQDPNNNKWSRSTNNFGHKIMAAQGWKPGEYLGAKDANHAEHYTRANASHIKVVLKDDSMGLGMKLGNQNAETFGLSMFSGLLGRLNGKTDESLKKEEDSRRDVELALYQGRKYGQVTFVSAGFLVGDKITTKDETKAHSLPELARKQKSDGQVPVVAIIEVEDNIERTDKKRKRKQKVEVESEDTAEETTRATPRKRRKDKEVGLSSAVADNHTSSDSSEDSAAEKRRRKKEKKARRSENHLSTDVHLVEGKKDAKALHKAEKATRKEERRRRKEEKRARKAAKASGSDVSSTATPLATADSLSGSGTSTPTPVAARPVGRQAVRQRYIQQKRMAGLDPKALNEIFMIKSGA